MMANPIAKKKHVGVNGEPRSRQDTSERDAIEAKYRDFFWTYTEEPHRTRRLEIIKAHPDVGCPLCPLELALWPVS